MQIKNLTKIPTGVQKKWPVMTMALLLTLACSVGSGAGTAIPAGRPANFEVQTITPTANSTQIAAQSTPVEVEAKAAPVLSLGDAPTHTPDPNVKPTLLSLPTNTSQPTILETQDSKLLTPAANVITSTASATVAATVLPTKVVEPDPPLAGGDWDFEANFIPWGNPYGEPCPGASVAAGWTAFVEQGEYGSSCMNENLYQPNVFSGLKAQEITFDFIAANSGIYRTISVKENHRYKIMAYAKHDHSIAPVQMFLGVDFSGGTNWDEETIKWFPWDDETEDAWVATETTVTATGPNMTIFIRGIHFLAEQGGKTVVDNVSVTDLGL